MDRKYERYSFLIKGIVQGVGFRPFIYNLANNYNLKGFVLNDGQGVYIQVQGEPEYIQFFYKDILKKSPTNSFIEDITVEKINILEEEDGFIILHSSKGERKNKYIPPDICMCNDCKNEITDPLNRRYQYPFTNCTNCGPRFSIIKDIPYDRQFTTMDIFNMCDKCRSEYEDPKNRRYHAQPICCKDCGPKLCLIDNKGNNIDFSFNYLRNLIKEGKVILIKGIGGFHIICNPKNKQAVLKIRELKHRSKKPFALMLRDIDVAKRYCKVSSHEEELLSSCQSPIVILNKKFNCFGNISNTNKLGVLMPYTPLHMMLFDEEIDVIVATSGNLSGESIIYKDVDALLKLNTVVDFTLLHNRKINMPIEDSVVMSYRNKEYVIRRGRGYAPNPIDLSFLELKSKSVMAFGGELKNTFCLTKDNRAFVSGYIGDLKNVSVLERFKKEFSYYKKVFNIDQEVNAFDMHPNYISSKIANGLSDKIQIPIQHHHAHVASCMAENKLNEKVIGVAFDGSGYGDDNAIWGGEFLVCDYKEYNRRYHFQYVKMPGGDICTKEPIRMKNSYLYDYGLFSPETNEEIILNNQLKKEINCPLTSSVGRLFDGVSSLLGLCNTSSYEAEAAILLENICNTSTKGKYNFNINNNVIELKSIFSQIILDKDMRVAISEIAMKFHRTLASIVLDCCNKIRGDTGINKVCLTGGVFQNLILLRLCNEILIDDGFNVYTHSKIPANDGGISLGQAVIAYVRRGN